MNKLFWKNLVIGKPLPNCTISHAWYQRAIGNKKVLGIEVEVNVDTNPIKESGNEKVRIELNRLGFDLRNYDTREIRYTFRNLADPFSFRNKFFWFCSVLDELNVTLLGSFHINLQSDPKWYGPNSEGVSLTPACKRIPREENDVRRWENKYGPNGITPIEVFCKILCISSVRIIFTPSDTQIKKKASLKFDYTRPYKLAKVLDSMLPSMRLGSCSDYLNEVKKHFHYISSNY